MISFLAKCGTRNRIEILVPWLFSLVLSSLVGVFSVVLGFWVFLILSLVARIIVIKRSPFAGLFAEDFAERLKTEEEIALKDGRILKTEEIKRTKRTLKIFVWISPVSLSLIPLLLDESLAFLGYAFWIMTFQALSKTYLIVKDSPLSGFPFFRSNNVRSSNNSFDKNISIGIIDNPMNPLHPTNIGNPANPNYIFK